MRSTVDIQIATPRATRLSARALRATAKTAWRVLGKTAGTITIRITSGREVRRLNTRYRGQPKITDILTFPYRQDGVLCGGDIVIAIESALRQAAKRRVSLADECCRLMIHGLCHLAGYHHHSVAAFAVMRKIECETLLRVLSR